jgi:hypothetical protein
MSLELALNALTASIEALALKLKGPDTPEREAPPPKPTSPRDDAASAAKGAGKKPERSKSTPGAQSVELDQNPPDKSSESGEISQHRVPGQSVEQGAVVSQISSQNAQDAYNRAATAITTLARQKGRDAALQVLESFGASRLPNVAPELLESVTQAAQEALSEVTA